MQSHSRRTPAPAPRHDALIGFLLVALYAAGAYILVLGPYQRFTGSVLPSGDPFTYTFGLFGLLDRARADPVTTIRAILIGHVNWYWLMNLPVAIFAPFLAKEPFSLALGNYIYIGLASYSLLRLGQRLGLGIGGAFAVSLVPWAFPVQYGFYEYSAIPVLGLDSAFMSAVTLMCARLALYALDMERRDHALWAGLAAGLAIWGRGNSIAVVGLVGLVPGLYLLRAAWISGSTRVRVNVVLLAAAALAMTAWFYGANWRPIATYYADHAKFVERHSWNLGQATRYLWNIPGFMILRRADSNAVLAISLATHAGVLLACLWAWWTRPGSPAARARRLLVFWGAFVYFATFFINVALWTDPHLTIQNSLLIWRPMIVGLTLIGVALVVALWGAIATAAGPKWAFVLMALGWTYGSYMHHQLTPREWAQGRPSPRDMERFAIAATDAVGGRPVSVLWYKSYNPTILRYYMAKNDRGDFNIYRGRHYDAIWSHVDYSEANRARVRIEFADHLANAAMLVVPEFLDDYRHPPEPYAYYRFKDEMAALLNAPDAPRLVVRYLLEDSPGVRLLVLQREADAGGAGAPMRMPWGNRAAMAGRPDYGPEAVRFR